MTDLLKVMRRRSQQLLAVAHPALAAADVHAQADVVKPRADAVAVPARERHVEVVLQRTRVARADATGSCGAHAAAPEVAALLVKLLRVAALQPSR